MKESARGGATIRRLRSARGWVLAALLVGVAVALSVDDAATGLSGPTTSTLALANLGPTGSFTTASTGCSGVSMYPSPGGRTASPTTQIAFRGISAPRLAAAAVSVRGAQSGLHRSRFVADSDGRGGSLYPITPFLSGETVTVTAPFTICGAGGSTATFRVQSPPPAQHAAQGFGSSPGTPATQLQHFQSAPGIEPPTLTASGAAPAGEGDFLLNPKGGTAAGGPMIVDGSGNLVWFDPLPLGVNSSDLQVQSLAGQPVLTWWQGQIVSPGYGIGEDVIMNDHYQVVDVFKGADGYAPDLHEFLLEPDGILWTTAYSEAGWDLSSVGGPSDAAVLDAIVQEVDLATGNVLFEWHSLDHVDPSLSVIAYGGPQAGPYDYFHVNAIDPSGHGTVLISARNTDAAYLLDLRSGSVIWTLGGRNSSFRMGPGTRFALQHDAELRGSSTVTIFDDEADGRPARLIAIALDLPAGTASLAWSQTGPDRLAVSSQGNFQVIPDGNVVAGWGAGAGSPVTEMSSSGRLLFDATFPPQITSYRAYRQSWIGLPEAAPSVAAQVSAAGARVEVSWNGATGVASWVLLGGPSPASLAPLASAAATGFQTALTIATQVAYVELRAESASGAVLGQTAPEQLAGLLSS